MLLQDIRFGFRTALKNKGVTVLAVTCLGIGIGLNTMMFSVTDGVLVQPLPYQDPERIVALHTTQKQNGVREAGLSWLDPRCATTWGLMTPLSPLLSPAAAGSVRSAAR